MADEPILNVLQEIRELQRQQLECSRTSLANQQQSLANQQQSLAAQQQSVERQKMVLARSGKLWVFVLGAIFLLFFFSFLSYLPTLFRWLSGH